MRRTIALFAIAALMATSALYAKARKGNSPDGTPTALRKDPDSQARTKQPEVDIVIALDTSGSMSGLINAARQKLWDIVSEVAKAEPTPRLRVGLVTYGSGGNETDGYVIVQRDLTSDLDAIYGKLFELSTSGGTEYVSRAIFRSLKELSWSADPDALRQIYVAGNESADQDRQVSLQQALSLARQKDVFVNAIYCGAANQSDALSWRTVAGSGRGVFAAIDHNHGTVAVTSPYDQRLNELSARLNRTYLHYGPAGSGRLGNQARQDLNARRLSPSAGAARAVAKASTVYRNESWDLVDAKKAGKLAAIKKEALPAQLRGLSDDELKKRVEVKAQERESIRREISQLATKRARYVEDQVKRSGKDKGRAFGYAVQTALRQQAKAKKIRFKN